MDCDAAKGLAAAYHACAAIYDGLGNKAMASFMNGQAVGVRAGACT
jgi:hypothetical protein